MRKREATYLSVEIFVHWKRRPGYTPGIWSKTWGIVRALFQTLSFEDSDIRPEG